MAINGGKHAEPTGVGHRPPPVDVDLANRVARPLVGVEQIHEPRRNAGHLDNCEDAGLFVAETAAALKKLFVQQPAVGAAVRVPAAAWWDG